VLPGRVTGAVIIAANCRVFFSANGADALMVNQHIQNDRQFAL
jgi:hypothetical protein